MVINHFLRYFFVALGFLFIQKAFSGENHYPISIDIVYPPHFPEKLAPRLYFCLNDIYSECCLKNESFPANEEIELLQELKRSCEEEAAGGIHYPITPALVDNLFTIRMQILEAVKDPADFTCIIAKTRATSNNQFKIATELCTVASKYELYNDQPETFLKAFSMDNSMTLTEIIAPSLFAVTKDIAQSFGIQIPLIHLTEGSLCASSSYNYLTKTPSHQIMLGVCYCAFMTDEEISFTLAHEMAHLAQQHGYLHCASLPLISPSDSPADLYAEGEAFCRAYECEADAYAIAYTKNPLALITSSLKAQMMLTSSLKQTSSEDVLLNLSSEQDADPTHPTTHERISYALSHLTD